MGEKTITLTTKTYLRLRQIREQRIMATGQIKFSYDRLLREILGDEI